MPKDTGRKNAPCVIYYMTDDGEEKGTGNRYYRIPESRFRARKGQFQTGLVSQDRVKC